MKTKIAAILAITSLVVAFQNCGKVQSPSTSAGSSGPTGGSAGTSSGGASATLGSGSSASANVLQNGTGQNLTFLSINKESLGDITAVSTQNNQIYLNLKNPNSGRKAIVVVDLDPSTKKFKAVSSSGAPYMCYDPAQGPCATVTIPAGFTNAGTAAVNCGSPIFFTGALSGSVNNIVKENYANCGY